AYIQNADPIHLVLDTSLGGDSGLHVSNNRSIYVEAGTIEVYNKNNYTVSFIISYTPRYTDAPVSVSPVPTFCSQYWHCSSKHCSNRSTRLT
ncbi:hypothetical protein MJL30_33530, partial [Salmonella enterica subsp. enterica serovar Anatum]|nr:hypothetical protein [Salmonella enterica subsp. enterica serovar Anatum]